MKDLHLVAEVLDHTHPDEFSMQRWVYECGTGACAIGKFCDAYPDDNLKLSADDYGQRRPVHGNKSGHAAIAQRFDISEAESLYLFGTGNESCPITVGNKIRSFVRTGKQ